MPRWTTLPVLYTNEKHATQAATIPTENALPTAKTSAARLFKFEIKVGRHDASR